jgi:plasmid stabilization system protein ParE
MAEVDFHPAASLEYFAALEWYRTRSLRAARRFAAEVGRVVSALAEDPERYPWHEEPFREAALVRYPYRLIYRIEPTGEVLIVAIAHASREPDYWHGRN